MRLRNAWEAEEQEDQNIDGSEEAVVRGEKQQLEDPVENEA